MNALSEFIGLAALILVLVLIVAWAASGLIKDEVAEQIDTKLELEIRRMQAMHEVRDELRRSSRELINVALEIPSINDERFDG